MKSLLFSTIILLFSKEILCNLSIREGKLFSGGRKLSLEMLQFKGMKGENKIYYGKPEGTMNLCLTVNPDGQIIGLSTGSSCINRFLPLTPPEDFQQGPADEQNHSDRISPPVPGRGANGLPSMPPRIPQSEPEVPPLKSLFGHYSVNNVSPYDTDLSTITAQLEKYGLSFNF